VAPVTSLAWMPGGRKNKPGALKSAELWTMAANLWRLHESDEHEIHDEIMAVHMVVVELATARDGKAREVLTRRSPVK